MKKVLLFVAIGVTGVVLSWTCIRLYAPPRRLTLDEKAAQCIHVAERAGPLIRAIRDFERNRGRPPDQLRELMPQYLHRIPETGVEGFPDFEYRVFPRGLWYDLGDASEGAPRKGYWHATLGPLERALLVIECDSSGKVTGVEAIRLGKGISTNLFDRVAWRGDVEGRRLMVNSLLRTAAPLWKRVDDAIHDLGPPDHNGVLGPVPWELRASTPRYFTNAANIVYWPNQAYDCPTPSVQIGDWLYVDDPF